MALLRAVVGMVSPGQRELNPAVNAVQSMIVVLVSGQPRIALLHNTPAAFHGLLVYLMVFPASGR